MDMGRDDGRESGRGCAAGLADEKSGPSKLVVEDEGSTEAMGCFPEGDGGAGEVPAEGVLLCGELPPHSDMKESTVRERSISECWCSAVR